MTSIGVAKMLSEEHFFAGRNWTYKWRELSETLAEKKCQKVWGSLAKQYSKITKNWDSSRNSEWICRIYLSAKMIMSSTLQLNSLEYTEDRNVRIVSAYLRYYAILSAVRSIVYTLPSMEWGSGKLFQISHNLAINIAFDYMSKFDQNLSKKLKNEVLKLKACRELISYRAPTSGDYAVDDGSDLDRIRMCTLLVEVAQFNSEILESSIQKNASKDTFEFEHEYIEPLATITIGDFDFDDREDAYRLDYLRRKWPVAPNILHIMTEGHTEDFFGAWDSKEDNPHEDAFDAGGPTDWQTIFDIP